MKKFGKKILAFTLSASLVLAGSFSTFAASPSPANTTEGPKVLLNDQYVTFSDAAPKAVNGRVMVPFRPVLEKMGATVNFDQATNKVTASIGNTAISFAIGDSNLTVEKDGKTSTVQMDVAPFAEANNTYVSSRSIVESFGYTIGWDAANQCQIIIDLDSLLSNVDTDFSVFSMLTTTNMDMSKTYKTTGDLALDMTMYPDQTAIAAGAPEKLAYKMDGTLSALQQKTDLDMKMALNMDMSQFITALPADQQEAMKAAADQFKNMNFVMKMNGETGTMYIQSPLFSSLGVEENAWMKMDIFKVYNDMGIDLESLMATATGSVNIDLKDMIKDMIASTSTEYTVDTYNSIKATYTIVKNLIGNDAFKKQTAGDATTYTLSLDAASITAALTKSIAELGITDVASADLSSLKTTLSSYDLKGNIMLKEKNGVLSDYSMDVSFNAEGTKASINIVADTLNAKVKATMSSPNLMDLSMSINTKSEETTEKLDITVPSNAKIVDYEELMNQAQQAPTLPL